MISFIRIGISSHFHIIETEKNKIVYKEIELIIVSKSITGFPVIV